MGAIRNGTGKGGPVLYPALYDEATFRHFLSVDQARVERAGRPLVLMLVESRDSVNPVKSLDEVLRVLRDSLRASDYIGWYRENRIVGAVLAWSGNRTSEEVCTAVRGRATAALDGVASRRGRSFNLELRPLLPNTESRLPL